jgi:YgiT-type zinc finger domain-containing protein
MGDRFEIEEGAEMKCRVCGSALRRSITDLPFKVSDRTIVILKELPVEQCEACSEYLIEDGVFAKVEALLSGVDASAELEIIPFAA